MFAAKTFVGSMPICANSSRRLGDADARTNVTGDHVTQAGWRLMLFEAESDPAFGQVIGCHFDIDLVAGQDPDPVLAHLA